MQDSGTGRARIAAVTGGVTPTSHRLGVGALDLHCLVWGAAGDPVAVLVHGNGGHAHWWDPLVPALVPGWRLIAVDLRGHGESQWPEPARYRIEDYAADLAGVIGALAPRRPVVVGHSMGGRIAAWYAAHHPGQVRGLGLLDTRMSGMNQKLAQKWRGRIAGTRQGRGYPSFEAALAAFRLVPDEAGVAPEILADLAYHAVHQRGPGDWTFRFDRAVLSLEGDGAGALYGLLGAIRCPAMLMHGAASWVMDAGECAALMRAIPTCTTRTFPGGHHFLLAHPQPVGAALREFLDGCEEQGNHG